MFSHVTIGTNDIGPAKAFYDAVMGAIGQERFYSGDGFAAYGSENDNQTWVMAPFDGKPASVGNGMHIAFLAPNRAAVDEAHRQALDHGGSDEGAPGLRTHYHPSYYAAYMRDPDGNKIQVVCHAPE